MTGASVNGPVADAGSPIRVLIAEDETHLGTILEQFMTARGFVVRVVRDGRTALDTLRRETFDVALLDVVMPEIDGLEVLRLAREAPLPPEIIVITGNGTIETAMAALKLGAYDCLSKPYRMAEIEALVRRAWEKRMLARDNRYLRTRLARLTPAVPFVTQFAPLRAVLAMVGKFAPSPLPVLVTGEAGTGKGLVATLLHEQGARPGGPFVRVDCAALDPAMQGGELLGVDGDAEPGKADEGRQLGALELAAGGTLYLERLECLGRAAQEALSAALDTGHYTRRHGVQALPLDVRLVASSGREPAALVTAGFDESLVHRLSAMRVTLPALRERLVDVPLLARHFVELARPGVRLADEAVAALEGYAWPGNVRELRLVLERAVLLAEHGVVEASFLGLPSGNPVSGVSLGGAPPGSAPTGGASTGGAPSLGELEKRHIAEVLERTGWHQGRAAELLGISPKTLYRKIREYGFKRPSGRTS